MKRCGRAAGSRPGAQRHRFRFFGRTWNIALHMRRPDSPKFLIDAGGAAIAAGHYGAGMARCARRFRNWRRGASRKFRTTPGARRFRFPTNRVCDSSRARNQVDPMLVAGLIRQESAFESKAMSHAGAMGLMQVMPKTALKLARQLKVRYARARIDRSGLQFATWFALPGQSDPAFSTPEAALAAYNAGEDRVVQWTAGQNYLETAEFVESIPFTETREYVQIVIRNSDVYRQVYGRRRPLQQEEARRAKFRENGFGEHAWPTPVARRTNRFPPAPETMSALSAGEALHHRREPGCGRRAAKTIRQGRAIHRIRDSRNDAPGAAARRREHGAGVSRFSGLRGSKGSRAPGHLRRHQSVRHHLGRQGIARRHCAQI